MSRFDVIIVGTGHGGAQAAISLRQQGFPGSILMIGRDAEAPYERPPLSKEYLLGERTFDRILIRPRDFWQSKQIELKSGVSVEAVDPLRRQVRLSSGEVASYENLIWAAGGEPRRLTCPGSDLEGVHYVRHKADVEAILQDLSGGPKRVVVVGGGYIGLEAAAVLTKLGHGVMLLEAQSRLLARVAGPDLSTFFEATHRDQGVDVRTDCELTALRGAMGRVAGVELAGGEVLGADLVIVGIGIVPSIEALSQAGCDCSNGVAVDSQCQTSVPNIYAIGDCALHTNRFAGGATLRLESVQNAHDMAAV